MITITIPFQSLVVLPGITIYFKKDFFSEITGNHFPEIGEKVMFLMMKNDKERNELTEDDIYPIGVLGKVCSMDKDKNVGVEAVSRVKITNITVEESAPSKLREAEKMMEEIIDSLEAELENRRKKRGKKADEEPALSDGEMEAEQEDAERSLDETLDGDIEDADFDGFPEDKEDGAGEPLEDEERWTRFHIEYKVLKTKQDLTEDEKQERFERVRNQVIQFTNGFPWALMVRNMIKSWDSMEEMISAISQFMTITNEDNNALLNYDSVSELYDRLEQIIYESVEFAKVGEETAKEQEEKHENAYREFAIKKQIEMLQKQLDDMHPETMTDEKRFEEAIRKSGMNETARKEAEKALSRMRQEGESGHEYGMLYDYLDFVTALSWKKEEYKEIDLNRAREILDEDHYGLKKVKRRIIEQIAVMALKKKQSGSILLLVGAPGTGKTSIGKSVARALGREYVRVSLGGIRDEAEIRGHRRTYIGAMPGRIMEGIKRSGVSNPVIVLDEVDKLISEVHGDPSAALLEVLDPEQNNTFTDHYMNVPYDLSDVLFICTANTVDSIPDPLLNRMEMIEFQGYTETEKMEIAKRHLIPKALEDSGMKKSKLKISDNVLHKIIADFTMEAGVRGLRKRIDTLCRVSAVKLLTEDLKCVTVRADQLRELLDMKPIYHDNVKEKKSPGIITGLAWTQSGGDVLFIETKLTKGKGEIRITGQLGDVMKESAQVAVTLVKSLFPEKAPAFEENDIHIHVPEGAIPKDGPSAGITMVTALSSLLMKKAVKASYAMTGEVSLQGNVMPIGGLPEKLMAAVRAGVKTVFIPKENVEDLEEVAAEVKEKLKIIPVKKAEDVLRETGVI